MNQIWSPWSAIKGQDD